MARIDQKITIQSYRICHLTSLVTEIYYTIYLIHHALCDIKNNKVYIHRGSSNDRFDVSKDF